jgi:hypothetical protein
MTSEAREGKRGGGAVGRLAAWAVRPGRRQAEGRQRGRTAMDDRLPMATTRLLRPGRAHSAGRVLQCGGLLKMDYPDGHGFGVRWQAKRDTALARPAMPRAWRRASMCESAVVALLPPSRRAKAPLRRGGGCRRTPKILGIVMRAMHSHRRHGARSNPCYPGHPWSERRRQRDSKGERDRRDGGWGGRRKAKV